MPGILRCMRFRATVELGGKTATGIEVPPEVVAGLGAGRRPRVRVTIGAHTYRSTVAPYGGRYLLPLSAANRTSAGVAAGDEVDVELEVDTEPREVTVPTDLAELLASDPVARAFFDGLSHTHRQAYVTWIEEAKRAETRRTRLARAVDMLHEGRSRS